MVIVSSDSSLPVVDLAPFTGEGNEEGKNRVVEEIRRACSDCGFFQVVNHGIPLELLKQALEVYQAFFDLSYEEKLNFIPKPGASAPHGYLKTPDIRKEGNEHFLMASPHLGLNSFPKTLPRFQQVLTEIYPTFAKLASLTEGIINQSLGLPVNFLKEYNDNREYDDFLLGLHYFPATEADYIGKAAHEDPSCITFLYQDEVGGLQVCKDGEWILVPPTEGAININLGDILQVLTNGKYKSATHKVIRTQGKNRYSYAFFHNLTSDKWVEPLPQFTEEIGELPRYRGFSLEEYNQLRRTNKDLPPERYQDRIRITRYAINHQD